MAIFDFNDIVIAKADARRAWIVGVAAESEGRVGSYYDKFPPGTVYTIEFEDGTSTDAHEDELALEHSGAAD